MPITFNDVPATARTPFVFVEFDPTRAQGSPGAQEYHALIIGQRFSGGATAANTPVELTREDQVATAFGTGSMIHAMSRAFFAQTRNIRATFIGVDDPSSGSPAPMTWTVTFTASSPKAGTVAMYVGGRRYAIAVSTSSTAGDIATAFVAAIAADPHAYVTASADAGEVTLTARHDGEEAGEIDVRHSYQTDEFLPVGVGITEASGGLIASNDDGAGTVDLTATIAAIPDEHYHVIANPYTSNANLTLLEAELADRFGPERQLEGLAFHAHAGNLTALQAINRNSPHVSILTAYRVPNPVWEVAAAMVGQVALSASIDPARPFQTLELEGILPPETAHRFTRAERDLLLNDGIATAVANASGGYAIERAITTYVTNDQGAADTAYLDATTLFTLSRLRYDFRTTLKVKYPRYKIADDGTRFAAGQSIVTPSSLRAEAVAIARVWEEQGLIEDLDQFKRDLIVERNSSDPTRVDFYLPPNLVNGLRVFAAKVGFGL